MLHTKFHRIISREDFFNLEKMKNKISEKYKTLHQTEPLLLKAPGRINLIGEHTDYNLGFVLPAAVDKAIYFAMGRNETADQINIYAFNFDNEIQFSTRDESLPDELSWAKYFHAIIQILQEKNYHLQGINCVFGGDIPVGAGMSSSAALCCGFIFGLSELFDWKISREDIALIAQAAEHRIGLNCGLMDQYAVLFGKENQVFRLDCKDLKYNHFDMQLADYQLVLINSKIEHQLALDSKYNKRRAACEAVVATIAQDHPDVKSLRDINMETLAAYAEKLNPKDYQRARFVIEENQRVQDTIKALKDGDLLEVGMLLYLSHDGLSRDYEVSTSGMDLLVSLTKQEKSILGARMMGGGFGGCTINLIHNKYVEEVTEKILMAYHEETGIQGEAYTVNIGDGVRVC